MSANPVVPGVAYHFGPLITEVGGMASVIRVLQEQSIGADVVVAVPTWSAAGPAATLQLVARALGRLATVGNADIVHVHLSERGSFVREGAFVRLGRLRGATTIITLHGAELAQFASRRPGLVRAVLNHADLITCLVPDMVENVRRMMPGRRVEYVANPVVVDLEPVDANHTAPVALFGGEIGRRKGADVLWHAWRQLGPLLPEAQCLMVGPAGDYVVEPLPGLTVKAPVSSSEMRRLVRDSRCVVLPSRAEALPMILLEAMALARPFVSTPVGGIRALAAGGRLVKQDDPVGLAAAMKVFLTDPHAATVVGRAGHADCLRHRSTTVVDAELRRLYAEVGDAR